MKRFIVDNLAMMCGVTRTVNARNDLIRNINDVVLNLRSRNNLPETISETQETTISLVEMCRLPAAEAVVIAYKIIIGRVPDLEGFRHYVTMLRRGILDRQQFLEVLQQSPEGKGRGVRILYNATEQEIAKADAIATTERVFYLDSEFAIADDDAFVTAAYQAILKRPPDSNGLANYRQDLAGNATRAQVLLSLLESDEFKSHGVPVVISGITPPNDILKTLFSIIENMSRNITSLEFRILNSNNS